MMSVRVPMVYYKEIELVVHVVVDLDILNKNRHPIHFHYTAQYPTVVSSSVKTINSPSSKVNRKANKTLV